MTFAFLLGLAMAVTSSFILRANHKSLKEVYADQEKLKHHVKTLCTTSGPRNWLNIEALNEAAEYIKNELRSYGYEPEEQKYFIRSGKDSARNYEYKNIIASIGPRDAERVIVGAHYDVCEDQPGADDNASGVGGLLEIARLLKELKPDLKYRVDLVAFTLEEPPFFTGKLMGSAVHAKSLKDTGAKVKAMISLEMIGYFSDEPKSQQYPLGALMKLVYPSRGNFIAVVGKLGQGRIVRHMKRSIKRVGAIKVCSINAPTFLTGIDWSDHRNYWHYGWNAVMITDTSFFRNKNYHEPTDKPETLNYACMAEVVKGVYHAVITM